MRLDTRTTQAPRHAARARRLRRGLPMVTAGVPIERAVQHHHADDDQADAGHLDRVEHLAEEEDADHHDGRRADPGPDGVDHPGGMVRRLIDSA